MITIYGLFDTDGQCRYVGQTCTPRSRKHNHKRKFPALQFRVLETCEWLLRNVRERELVMHYRNLGQCDMNRNLTGREKHRCSHCSKTKRHSVEVVGRDGSVRLVYEPDYDTEL